MRRTRSIGYLLVTISVAIGSGLLANFIYWASEVASCRYANQSGAYLSYCGHPLFGNYEHGAFEWEMRSVSVAALKEADIIILGSSVIQVALSTDAAEAYFRDIGARPYLFGFSHGEENLFPERLLRRFAPKPKLVIINTDPFFNDRLTDIAKDVVAGSWSTRLSYWRKQLFIALQPTICNWLKRCTDQIGAIYRRDLTGEWIWKTVWYPASAQLPIPESKEYTITTSDVAFWTESADRFIAKLGFDRGCIILTGTPNSRVDSAAIAASIGQALHIAVVTPHIEGLTTADGGHLSWDSAEKWSWRFLQDSSEIIRRCLFKAS